MEIYRVVWVISIHSPRMRGDEESASGMSEGVDFNPLPSHEGRHAARQGQAGALSISIHSPRMRGDAIQ